MRATSIKQIKFNRGQVSDLLSERVDMGLQNACGTVYDNVYINRYGQIQNSPSLVLSSNISVPYPESIICMFDTGTDKVYVITHDGTTGTESIKVYGPLLKSNPYTQVDFTHVLETESLTNPTNLAFAKCYQFGYNVVFFGDNKKPWLLNLVPGAADWTTLTLTVKEDYFDNAFDNIYVRGLNTDTPTGFTIPTSGYYTIADQTAITTKRIVTINRNSAGGNFTADLVGQVIQSPANGGALQIRTFVDADHLTAYVLSPLSALSGSDSNIKIPWSIGEGSAKWVFGYEQAYGAAVHNGDPSYPDSAIYVNQRLIFGGNDYNGSLISASRIGVINDFDPESATESDAFTTSIASKDFCRIVDFVVSNSELRIACTNGEYAMSLTNLTPSGSLNGFDLRSEVGIKSDTAICDCGGLTAYVSNDGNSVYGTQFSLLRDRYQPMSLTSQTSGIVNQCRQLVYLTNRPNDEGNCLVGRNADGSMFIGNIDLNAGLIGLTKMQNTSITGQGSTLHVFPSKLWRCGSSLWGVFVFNLGASTASVLTRFVFGEMFDFPTWFIQDAPGEQHPETITVPWYIGQLAFKNQEQYDRYRALYYNQATQEYEIIKPTGYTINTDTTWTINFADDIIKSNIVCAGFYRQSDWRSVEIGVGMATREINKQIIKLEGVIEPTQITGQGTFAGLVLTPEESKNFITLTRSRNIEPMDVDNLRNTSYTESADIVWRRAFENPSRCLYYGVSAICPLLLKSITCVIQYDEVA